MKKFLLMFLCTALLATSIAFVLPTAIAQDFPFTDVPENAWYRKDVEIAYEKGLIGGKTDTTYVPAENMTIAEAVKLSACMYQLYTEGEITLKNGVAPKKWYSTYMEYAGKMDIITEDLSDRANEKITRRDFVKVFYGALPASEYGTKNRVTDDFIPDVKMADKNAVEIYTFYRAGILTGSDDKGTFNPESNIVRSEVAAILTRMFDKEARKEITLANAAEKPEMFVNTLYKLENEKKLTVGYFGGSVTVGSGSSNGDKRSWRAITRDWLKKEFPDAEITERNAAIGGTGSLFGIFRADTHYILDKAPDLNFIEMSINDNYDGVYNNDENYVFIEAIIRKIYASNPKADIVFVITGDNSTMGEQVKKTRSAYGEPYIKIGEYYNIPVVHAGHALSKIIYEENENAWPPADDIIWRNYFTDSVHPSDDGYEVYANTIIDGISPYILSGYTPTADEYLDIPLPEKYFCTAKGKEKGAYTVDKMLTATMISPDSFSDEAVGDYIIGTKEGVLTPLISNKKGESITFEFTASNIAIWTWSYGSGGGTNIKCAVDGGAAKTTNLFRAFPNYKVYTLATGLDNTKSHKIKIEHSDSNNPFKFYGIFLWDGANGEKATLTIPGTVSAETEGNAQEETPAAKLSAEPIEISITVAGERDQKCTFSQEKVKDTNGNRRTVTKIIPAKVDGAILPAWFANESQKEAQAKANYIHKYVKVVYYTESSSEDDPRLSTYTHNGTSMVGRGNGTLLDSEPARAKTWNVAYFEADSIGDDEMIYALQFGMYGKEPAKDHVGEEIYIGYMGLFASLEDAKAHKSNFEK